MRDAGVLHWDTCEFVEGLLLKILNESDEHAIVVARCETAINSTRIFRRHDFGYTDAQSVLELEDGVPRPDLIVAPGTIFEYQSIGPGPKDLMIVVEVAGKTLNRDRGIKLRSYARAGIACYWIVNLIDRQIEAHTEPDATPTEPTYLHRQVIAGDGKLDVVFNGHVVATITATDLLPAV